MSKVKVTKLCKSNAGYFNSISVFVQFVRTCTYTHYNDLVPIIIVTICSNCIALHTYMQLNRMYFVHNRIVIGVVSLQLPKPDKWHKW